MPQTVDPTRCCGGRGYQNPGGTTDGQADAHMAVSDRAHVPPNRAPADPGGPGRRTVLAGSSDSGLPTITSAFRRRSAARLGPGVSEMGEPVREEPNSDRVAGVADLGELQRSAGEPEGVLAGALARFWRASRHGGLRE